MTVAIIIYLSVGLVLSFLAILIHKLQNGGKITTGDEEVLQMIPRITFFWAFILIFFLTGGIVSIVTKVVELYTDFVDKVTTKLINKK